MNFKFHLNTLIFKLTITIMIIASIVLSTIADKFFPTPWHDNHTRHPYPTPRLWAHPTRVALIYIFIPLKRRTFNFMFESHYTWQNENIAPFTKRSQVQVMKTSLQNKSKTTYDIRFSPDLLKAENLVDLRLSYITLGFAKYETFRKVIANVCGISFWKKKYYSIINFSKIWNQDIFLTKCAVSHKTKLDNQN